MKSEPDDSKYEPLVPGAIICSFCEKNQADVRKMFVGPIIAGRTSCICNECVGVCNKMARKQRARTARQFRSVLKQVMESPPKTGSEAGVGALVRMIF